MGTTINETEKVEEFENYNIKITDYIINLATNK